MKTIYKPKGRAGEYARLAVNFYNGCSNGCEYCYLRRGVLARVCGGDAPVLQKKFKNECSALEDFKRDLEDAANLRAARENGIFFCFSSDPLIEGTRDLNIEAILHANGLGIPCMVLTKSAEGAMALAQRAWERRAAPDLIAMGFTLTGADNLEPNASPNAARLASMKELYEAGFWTWASIEPVIEPEMAWKMICESEPFCDHYKVGLRSGVGKDYYSEESLRELVRRISGNIDKPVYLKDSYAEMLGLDRTALGRPFVDAAYSVYA